MFKALKELLSKNLFVILLVATFFVLLFLFQAPLLALPLVLLFFFVPGYFFVGFFYSDEFDRALLSMPLSFVINVFFLYLFSIFFQTGIDAVFLLVPSALSIVVFFVFGQLREKVSVAGKTVLRKEVFLLIVFVILSFVYYSLFVARGGYSHEFPINVSAVDNSMNLTLIDWMAKTGKITVPDYLAPVQGIESANYSPPSLIGSAVFARLAGMNAWDAHYLFLALVFAGTILGVYYFSRTVFGKESIALVAAFIASIPFREFFFADITGMFRISLSVFLSAFALAFFVKFLQSEKNTEFFLPVFFAGIIMVHAADFPLFIVPAAFLVWLLFKQKKEKIAKIFFVVAVTALLSAPYFVAATAVYSNSGVGGTPQEFKITNPLDFDSFILVTVGPVLRIMQIKLFYVLLGLAIAIILLYQYGKDSRYDRPLLVFSLTGAFLLLFTSGFTNFYYMFAAKLRHQTYLLFAVPAIAFLLYKLWFFILKQAGKKYARIVLGAIAIIIISSLFFSTTFGPNQAPNRISDFAVLQFVQEKIPQEKSVLFLFDFSQLASLLSYRKSNYLMPQHSLDYNGLLLDLNNVPSPTCEPGIMRKNLLFVEAVVCPKTVFSLCDYDFLVLRNIFDEENLNKTKTLFAEVGYSEIKSFSGHFVFERKKGINECKELIRSAKTS